MQLLAQDEKDQTVLASDASKGKDYSCPECHRPVRLRKGPSRRPHFFHKSRQSGCRQYKKSWTHLQLQLFLLNLLPKGEGLIEKPYPEIKRIADVAWEAQGIIFEIQCSPISLIECMERNESYQSLGLTPVWILHDHRFNRRFLSAAERHLRKSLCFFSHIDPRGNRRIYDQFEIIKGANRLYRSKCLPVDLSRPIRSGNHLSFHGALPHRIEQNPALSTHIRTKEESFKSRLPRATLFSRVGKTYTVFLHLLLEMLAKPPS